MTTLATRADHGGVNFAQNAQIFSTELTRISDMTRVDRATLAAALLDATPVVFNGLAVSPTGTGLGIQVAAGEGVDGNGASVYVPSSVPSTAVAFGLAAEGVAPRVTLAAADPINPRVDLIYLRAATLLTDFNQVNTFDGTSASNQVLPATRMAYFSLGVVQGTPAASPVTPSPLLATDLVLAAVTVPAGATTLSGGNVADKRTLAASTTALAVAANTFTQPQTFVSANSQIFFGASSGQGHLWGTTSAAHLTYGADYQNGWTARQTGAAILALQSGVFNFYANTGLTVGNAMSPTLLAALNSNGLTMSAGKITAIAPTTSLASLNLPHGTAPTTPANGDLWTTSGGGLYVRVNGATWNMPNVSGTNTWGGKQTFFTPTTAAASINLPHGAAPTTPANGDMWTATNGLWVQINGSSLQMPNMNGANTWAGKQTLAGSTTSNASMNIPPGSSPTAPNNGDLWTTTTSLVIRLNSVTNTVAFINAAQTWTGQQTLNTASSQLLFGTAASQGYLFAGASNAFLGWGVDWVSGSPTARQTSASSIALNGGSVTLYANTGLTVGNAFTQTQVATFGPSSASVVGTLTATQFLGDGSQLTGIKSGTQAYQRQSVIQAAVDANGRPAFLSAVGGSLAVTLLATATPFVASLANGYLSSGAANDQLLAVTSDVASAWSGLTANTTNYLWAGLNAGTPQYGFSLLAPIVSDAQPAAYQDFLPVISGSDTGTPPYVVTESSISSGHAGFFVFDKQATTDGNTSWITASGVTTGWVQIDLGVNNGRVLTKYDVVGCPESGLTTRSPQAWTVQGSNDGSTWTVLDTQTTQTAWAQAERRSFTIANTTNYRYYKLNVTANNGGTLLEIAEWSMYTSPQVDQHWYNPVTGLMQRWSGAAWSPVQRHFVGHANTGASSVSSLVQYPIGALTFAGNINAPGNSRVRAYQSANQAFAANTLTKVLFQTTVTDTQGEYDGTGRITFKQPGTYLVLAGVRWASEASGNATWASIYKNGTEEVRFSQMATGAAIVTQSTGAAFIEVVAGDYAEIYAATSNAQSTDTTYGRAFTHFECIKIA